MPYRSRSTGASTRRTLLFVAVSILSASLTACGSLGGQDTIPPDPPSNVTATSEDGAIALSWTPPEADDLAGFHIYRASTPIEDVDRRTPIDGSEPLASSEFVDDTAENGTTYHYVVTAIDDAGNESDPSNSVAKTPFARPPGHP